MKNLKLITTIIIATLAISLTSCNKAKEPVLPPESTMQLNDTEFRSSNKTAGNWFTAAVQVGVWSTVIKLTFAIPIYAYEHAIEQEPKKINSNTWLWQYNVQMGAAELAVKLYGTVNDDGSVYWEMYVNDFKWFEGQNNADITAGYWDFYKNTTPPVKTLHIDWTMNYSDSTGTCKYTVVDTSDINYSSYIYYGKTDDGIFNCFFNIYGAKDTTYTDIEWNDESKNGRIRSGKIFGDDLWHCWDSNLQDCECQ